MATHDASNKPAKGSSVHAHVSILQPYMLKTVFEHESSPERQSSDNGYLLRQPSSARSFSSCQFNRLVCTQSFTMPEIARQLSTGVRPTWDLELEPQPSAASPVCHLSVPFMKVHITFPAHQHMCDHQWRGIDLCEVSWAFQIHVFAKMMVRGISSGPWRDLWAPLLVLLMSLIAAISGSICFFATPVRWGPDGHQGLSVSTLLLAVYVCI